MEKVWFILCEIEWLILNSLFNRLSCGHINFDKFWQLAKQVTEVMAWQQITCPFPKVQAVLHSLQTAPVFNENGKERENPRFSPLTKPFVNFH